MKIPDFFNIDYLGRGNPVQRRCYGILRDSRILELLAPYTPVMVGTIPIGIDIPGSDIDILCRARDFGELERLLEANFSDAGDYRCHSAGDAFVCSFIFDGMEIEVFAQYEPVTAQNGYRHMLTEYVLLQMHGEKFRREVIALKKAGIKTEPAFARALGLDGDPYRAVLEKGIDLGLY